MIITEQPPEFIPQRVWTMIHFYARTRRIPQYLDENRHDSLDLEEVASLVCMERTSFSRFFRKKIGIGFHAFLLRYRVSQAARLLEGSDDSITEITFELGFKDISTFDRTFKRITGKTPSEYRKDFISQLQEQRSQEPTAVK